MRIINLFLILICLFFVVGCNQQLNQPTGKVVQEIEPSKEVKSVTSIKGGSTKVKINPPQELKFSKEIKDYASKYCSIDLEDVDIKIATAKKITETDTALSTGTNIQRFEADDTKSQEKISKEVNANYIKEIFEKLPFEKVDESIDIWVSLSDLNLDFYIKKSGNTLIVEQRKKYPTAIWLITDKETMIRLHNSNNVCSTLKEYTQDDSLIMTDTSLSKWALLTKTGDLKDCISLS